MVNPAFADAARNMCEWGRKALDEIAPWIPPYPLLVAVSKMTGFFYMDSLPDGEWPSARLALEMQGADWAVVNHPTRPGYKLVVATRQVRRNALLCLEPLAAVGWIASAHNPDYGGVTFSEGWARIAKG